MYYLCKRFQGEIELLIAKFQKQGRSLAKGFCHQKKEFFEKIYINREVVQEASVWFYIKWMGKRNEPINSLSLLLRHRLKTIKEQKKRCFLLDTFRISVLKQRLLGDVFGSSGIHHHPSPITYHQNIFYNGEFDPGSGWTLATGLTHASRGETTLKLASMGVDRRTGE